MIYTPRNTSDGALSPPVQKPIRLAPVPFDIPPARRDETAPRSLPIKGKISAVDRRWLRGVARVKG